MTSEIVSPSDPLCGIVQRMSYELPVGDLCQEKVIPLTDEMLRVAIGHPDGLVVVSDDRKAAVVRFRNRIDWLLCRVEDIPTSGKEVLDVVMPPGSGYYGTVLNDALREAVQAARPDLVVSGSKLTAEPSGS